jgi:hypothetical protein
MQRRSFFWKLLAFFGLAIGAPSLVEARGLTTDSVNKVLRIGEKLFLESSSPSRKPLGYGLTHFTYCSRGKAWLVKWTGWKTEQDNDYVSGQWYTANCDSEGHPEKEIYVSGAPGHAHKMRAGGALRMKTSDWNELPSSQMSANELELAKVRAMNELLDLLDHEG